MLEHKVLFTSDMHGNKKQFETFLEYAAQIKPATVIIGGELAPKDLSISARNSRYIDAQKNFLGNELPMLVKPLKQGLPETNIFVMLGNDDCAVNLDILNSHPELYKEIHGKRFKIDDSHEIVGYSFVPITPFEIKDFEKFDLSEVPESVRKDYENRKRTTYRLEGIRSVREPDFGWKKYRFERAQEVSDSIQKDLNSEVFTAKPQNTVYVFHTPPDNTSLDVAHLDVTGENIHVGSFAVREFMQKYNPRITLHGHVHETVDMTGKFTDNIGQSLAMSAGNDDYNNKVAVLVFDLYKPQDAERIKLPCSSVGKLFSGFFKKR